MKKYEKSNLIIYSDFEVRKLKEENKDIDLLIPVDLSVLNIHIGDMPDHISNRLQLTQVKNVLIRFVDDYENNICTIHFLKSVDISSAQLNFTMDYNKHLIKLIKSEHWVDMEICDKSR